MSWSVLVTTRHDEVRSLVPPQPGDWVSARVTRDIFDARLAKSVNASVFERDELQPGQRIKGPAVVVEEGTSTLISSSFNATIDSAGALVLTVDNVESVDRHRGRTGTDAVANRVLADCP